MAASRLALNPNVVPMCSQCDSAGRLEGARTLRCAVIVNVAWRGPGSYDAVRRHAFRSGGLSVTLSDCPLESHRAPPPFGGLVRLLVHVLVLVLVLVQGSELSRPDS